MLLAGDRFGGGRRRGRRMGWVLHGEEGGISSSRTTALMVASQSVQVRVSVVASRTSFWKRNMAPGVFRLVAPRRKQQARTRPTRRP